MQEQFAAAKSAETQTSEQVQSTEGAATSSSGGIEPPFARVNSVTPRSPADLAGLKAGDKVVRFGTANWTNHERLSKVAAVVQESENVSFQLYLISHECFSNIGVKRPVTVKVLRDVSSSAASQPVELRLIPKRDWGGRGLLGCHLVPI